MKLETHQESDPRTVEPEGRLAELLSARELEVLASVAEGATNREIALELFIAPSTVQTHVKRILAKLGARGRTDAAVRYARSYERDTNPDNGAPEDGRQRISDAITDRLARAYRETMRLGDPSAAAAVVDEGLSGGLSAVEVQARVIAPAMRGIGELWERGEITVAEEHLATAVSHHVLRRLQPGLLRGRRDGDTVVVAAVHGEHHTLGLRMVADVFDGHGFDVRFFGADVPAASLAAWVEKHRPTAVALGVTMPLAAAALSRQVIDLRERDPELRVIVGGQGVPAVLRHLAGVPYIADTEHLAHILRTAVSGKLPAGIARGGVELLQPSDAGGG